MLVIRTFMKSMYKYEEYSSVVLARRTYYSLPQLSNETRPVAYEAETYADLRHKS